VDSNLNISHISKEGKLTSENASLLGKREGVTVGLILQFEFV